ncbi:MAG: hypothetical protein GF388_04395 [Candidatus Aegiribacteria sp.]|nr:hypothetical protein [Candidatus Aegiribacteria sp.]MBD3294475.1 hypothetical protein [Candidatus Fermentibacteria bacterium]
MKSLVILLAAASVCFGQFTFAIGEIGFEDPFDPDDYIKATIRVSETGNWNNVLACGETDAVMNWVYRTDEWRIAICDYVDVSCALIPRQGSTAPFRMKTRIPVELSFPMEVDFLFAPADDGGSGSEGTSSLSGTTWGDIKSTF